MGDDDEEGDDAMDDEVQAMGEDDDEEAAKTAKAAKKKAKKAKAAKEAEASEDKDEEVIEASAAKKGKKRKATEAGDKDLGAQADSDEEAPWERAAKSTSTADTGDMASFVFADFAAAVPSSSESEAEDNEEDADVEKKKLSKRQKKALKTADTEALRKREAENAEGRWAKDPRSIEDFERLLLTQGDTSIIWIRYMAFHLKMSDLERARQVAERAVKHVGFSEAQERFNAWVAIMNLECTFGTEESADAVFKRAVAHNDAKQVYIQLARIHERNKKIPLATKAYEAAARKFAQSKSVWLDFLAFLYKQGDLEGARKTLPKALAAVPRFKHPLVVSKAA